MNIQKKIFNWTFGSVFRTIGRIVAYIIIGYLMSLFIFNKEYVKADTYVEGVDTPWYKSDRTTRLPSRNAFDYIMQSSASLNSTMKLSWFYNSSYFNTTNIRGGYWELPFYVEAPVINKTTLNNAHQCYRWDLSSQGNWFCADEALYTYDESDYLTPNLTVQVIAVYDVGYTDICNVDLLNNRIHCPVATYTNLNGIASVQVFTNVWYSNNNSDTYNYYVGLGRKANKFQTDAGAIVNNQNQNHNETINTITNDTTYDENETSSFLEDFEEFLPDEGIVTQLVTLPIGLYTNILNSVNGTCQPFSLGSLMGTNLTLPCINVANYLGSQLWSITDILMSGFFILTIVRKFIKVFENMSSLKEGDVLGD